MQIVVDRSTIITRVNSPGGPEALCRGCKSPDGSVISHFFSVTNSLQPILWLGFAAQPRNRARELMWGSHPGARAPGRELPALRA
ncbi:hypothetical protein LF1_46710 [Rubripirellula obstinata]|uniref:Uncharacterized protein n=1 Tax=Rubripirellula obstinata TaxID=406547 RepID=A0A5B1CR40_9BACT|nr:hypothetical protein LF1_46710 [Rubripirellula obstinata]